MSDKDLDTMIPYIQDIAKEYIAVTPNYEGRAMEAECLKEHLDKYNLPVYAAKSIKDGVKTALNKAGATGTICAIGSLYLPVDIKLSLEELNA